MSDRSPSPAPKDNGDEAQRSRSPSPRRRSQSPVDNGRSGDDEDRAGSPRDGAAASRDDRDDRDDRGDRGDRGGRSEPVEGNPGNNVYVANLPLRLTEPELEETFGKFGRLEKCEVILDPVTRESRGFAFVTYEDVRDAEDAVKEMHGKEIQGRRLRVEIAKRRRGHEKTPGKYLGPRLASSKYGREGGGHRDGRERGPRDRSRSRGRGGRSRSRSRDRHARGRYDDRDRYDRRGGYDDRRGGGRRSADRYDDRRSRR